MVLADNPIAYWRLGEGSGTTAADASGNGRNGVYTGGVTLGVPGALNGDTDTADRFDGVDDSVQVPDDSALSLNGSWTIEFWARQITYPDNGFAGLLYKGDGGSKNGYSLWVDPYGGMWLWRKNDAISSGVGALTSSFRYFVLTYDGTNAQWYVDGVLTSTTAASWPANTGTAALAIGKSDVYGNDDIDEMALYNSALSAAQIAAHYAAGS